MFAKFLAAPVLALGLACLAAPAVGGAQQSMNSMHSAMECTPDAMHAAMTKMAHEMSSMQSSGDMDKDYAHAMMAMSKDQRDLSAWEMKCGKDSTTMKMGKDSMHGAQSQYKAWSGIAGGA
jgi:hypothetical protein